MSPTKKSVLWLMLATCALGCMQFYVARIWSAGQSPHFSDLYAPWWGAHALFTQGRSPYSPTVAHEIQTVIYGAPIGSPHGGPSEFEGGFAYPVYAAFLLWPTTRLPFSAVQTIFFFSSILLTVASLALWIRSLRLLIPPIDLLTFALFAMGSFPVLQGIRLQNLSLIAAAFLALSAMLLRSHHLLPAGIFLAVSTFKPQFTIVLIPWLALWAASDWRRRQSLVWSFLASMLVLIDVSEWLVPGWLADFVHIVHAYKQYTFGHSLIDVWFPAPLGQLVTAALLLVVLALSWQCRHAPASSPRFFLAVALMLAATVTVIPTLAPHAQLLLIPGLLYLYCNRAVILRSRKSARLAFVAVWLLVAWQWIAAAGLALAAMLMTENELLRWWAVPLYPSPLLPLAVSVALSCLIGVEGLGSGDGQSLASRRVPVTAHGTSHSNEPLLRKKLPSSAILQGIMARTKSPRSAVHRAPS